MAKNKNCLEGLRCPSCGHDEEIVVNVTMWVSLRDDGTDPYADSTKMCGDVEYGDGSPARCPKCGHFGLLNKWKYKNKKGTI